MCIQRNIIRSLSILLCLLVILPTASAVRAQTSNQATDESSTIARVRERDNVLLAGVKQDFKPFGYRETNGDLAGFDVDIIQAMADIWGVEVEFVPVTSGNRIPMLMDGEVDIVGASMTHTRPRDADIDYSQTYFLDGQSLLVSKASGIENIEGMANKTVAAVEGSTSIEQIRQYAELQGVPLTVAPFVDYSAALVALNDGEVDALTTDRGFLLQAAQDNPNLTVVGRQFTQEPYGLGVRSSDSHFRNLVDFTLQELYRNGTYISIFGHWFPGVEPYAIDLTPGEWPYAFDAMPDDWSPPAFTRMAQIVQDRELVAGVRYDLPPFGYLNEDNKLVGFEVDIAREFARRWLGDPEAVQLVRVTSASAIPALAGDEVDLLVASITHRQEDDADVDFSQPYLLDGQRLLVSRDSNINSLNDLDGLTVGAISGTPAMDNITSLAADAGLTIEVIPFQEHLAAMRALEAGYVDAVTANNRALVDFAAGNVELDVVGDRLSDEPYAVGIPNFDAGFRDLVNFTLQEMKLDGAYDAIYDAWFDDGEPYPIELWPGSSPRSSSIRLSNVFASSAITPEPAAATSIPVPTPTATPTSISGSSTTPVLAPTASANANITPLPTSTPRPTPTLQPTPASGRYITIPTEYGVYARKATSTESESVRLLPNRTLYEAVARTLDDNWIQILLDNGDTAWVFSGVVDIAPAQLAELSTVLVNETGAAIATVTPETKPTAPTPTTATPTVEPLEIPPEGTVYLVQSGDYLALIADKYYGDLLLWPVIYEANRERIGENPGVIESGLRLVIPPKP